MDRHAVFERRASRLAAIEDYPFGDDVAVFKVAGKMFAMVPSAVSPGPSR